MFWNKGKKCPITNEDKDWVVEAYKWLLNEFGINCLLTKNVIHPTKNQFERKFDGTEADAFYLLDIIKSIMDIYDRNIKLSFYSNSNNLELVEGIIIEKGNYEINLGHFVQYSDGNIELFLDRGILKNPISLIATIGHELAHVKLLAERRIDANDEYLTDLTVLFFGLGIFNANTAITKLSTWVGLSHTGWQVIGGEGYLHYKVQAFCLALRSFIRSENIEWIEYLDKEIKKEFKKSLYYINSNKDEFEFLKRF